jgi:hypothetical protein
MWTLAASVTIRYQNLHELFYARARKYAELAEMSGQGEKVTSTAIAQAWILIGIYELKMMYYPRVWLSTGRAVRLAQMMGMHRLDGLSSDLKQTLLPPRDWIEKEERRRTFWMAFCMDRYATVGTGWPVAIDEGDVSRPLVLRPSCCIKPLIMGIDSYSPTMLRRSIWARPRNSHGFS